MRFALVVARIPDLRPRLILWRAAHANLEANVSPHAAVGRPPFPKDHPLRALYVADRPGESKPQPAVNLLGHHGVRSCLEYQKTGDIEAARRRLNPDLAPHLSFLDMGGHGYATVRVTRDAIDTEFVCIPRPLERSAREDGGPLVYRVAHRAALWNKGERSKLEQRVIEGNPTLSLQG